MVANIDKMAYTGEVPWHGLGTKVDHVMTAAEAIAAAGMTWKVLKENVFSKNGDAFSPIPWKFCTKRDDNQQVLGVVGSVYTPVQNSEAFSFFDAVVGEKLAMYHTCGSLGIGERIWIMAKLPKEIRVTKNDVVNCFLLLVNSHDGTSGLRMLFSPVRVVCQNTLRAALGRSVGSEVNLRHCTTIGAKVQQARDTLGLAVSYYNVFEEVSKKFVEKKLVQSGVESILSSIGLDDKSILKSEEDGNARKKNIRDQVLNLYENGMGNSDPDVKHSLWALINGVAEFTDHHRSTRVTSEISEQESRLDSQWFGSGAQMKERVFARAMEMVK